MKAYTLIRAQVTDQGGLRFEKAIGMAIGIA